MSVCRRKAHLYRLADVPTVPTVHAGTALPEELQLILDHLEPLPGVVLSARYDVLAHNKPYVAVGKEFSTELCAESEDFAALWARNDVAVHLPRRGGVVTALIRKAG
ncbi:MmyB family transcriptional regulator [Nocardia australiensis]|uniref:MmyB family transcriptional regulator n=1 Tax=Nocardia australiensis TaxID=2887191 RepID=UPI001D1380E6|nr:hypothetical protein [Nocardia australiensis]